MRLTNCRVIEPAAADPAWAAYQAALKPAAGAAASTERRPVTLADLNPGDMAQLVACIQACVGKLVSAADVASGAVARGGDEAAEMFAMPIEWWDVSDGERPLYQLWLYHADCGGLFSDGTTDSMGSFIQTFFEPGDDFADVEALAGAKTEAEARCPDSLLGAYRIG